MATKQEIQAIIDGMSSARKAGQLFLLAYPGKDPKTVKPLIDEYGICGCYISQDNAETFAEAAQVSSELQAMSMAACGLPLLLGVDQEGAWGVLVPESHTGPGNLALGAADDQEIIADMYRAFGREMLSAGYNALLGPCADVNSNPRSPIIGTRSFGEFPERVARCVESAVKGALSSGALATLKHFPGHGATEGDTHRIIPEVRKSLEELRRGDLLPFRAGIRVGAHIVMTAHIRFPRIDPNYPATLSRIMLQDLLRDELGFSGLIISDSMNMGAIRKFYDPAQSTLLALKAGVDVVMLSEEHYDHSESYLEKQRASVEMVRNAIESGQLSEEEVHEKLFRILDIKLNRMQIACPALEETEKANIAATEIRAARKGCLLLQTGMWPLPDQGTVICVNAAPRESYGTMMNPRGIGPNQAKPAFDAFREAFAELESGAVFVSFEELQNGETFSLLDQSAAIIAVTEDYPLPGEDFRKDKQQALVQSLAERFGSKLIVLGLRSSYELSLYPETIAYLCSYSSRACSAREAAKLLSQRDSVNPGKAPVTVRNGERNYGRSL